MIDVYCWYTGAVQRVLMFLEEADAPYNAIPINVAKGEQYSEEYIRVCPNSKIPVIVDHDPADGGEPITVFESGAILLYLAEKTGRFLPTAIRDRMEVVQWLFWHMANLGPIGGQIVHFLNFAPEGNDYARARYGAEFDRLLQVLDLRLESREFIHRDYSIADMACYSRITGQERRGQIDFKRHPHIHRWFETIGARPATERAYAVTKAIAGDSPGKTAKDLTLDERRILFGEHAVAGR